MVFTNKLLSWCPWAPRRRSWTEVCHPPVCIVIAVSKVHQPKPSRSTRDIPVMVAFLIALAKLISVGWQLCMLRSKRQTHTCMAFQWTLSGPALMRRWRSTDGQRVPPAPGNRCSHSSPSSSSSSFSVGCEPAPLRVEAGAGGVAAAASDAGSKGDCGACSQGVSGRQGPMICCLRRILPR